MLAAAEGEIRGDLRQPQLADQGTVWVVAMQAVISGPPEATEMIKSNAVIALRIGTEELAAGELSMINVEDPDVVQFAVDDEQLTLVWGERQAIGLSEVLGYRGQLVVVKIETVDVA